MPNVRPLRALPLLTVILASTMVLACGGGTDSGGTTPPVSAPVIASFTATPSTITTGASSTLAWSVSGATSLSINQGVGTVAGSSTTVSPTSTTTYTLTATNSGGSATATAMVTVSGGGASQTAALQVVSGNSQTGTVGKELAAAVVVHAVDASGKDVPQQVINFRVVSGGGSVFAGVAITDAKGVAMERWSLGTDAILPQQLEARAVDSTTGQGIVFATFTCAAVADAATTVAVYSGNGQTASPGSLLPLPIRGRVEDKFHNSIAGVTVQISVVTGNGSLSPTSAVSDSTGLVTANWTLGPGSGEQRAEMKALDLATAAFTATATTSPAGAPTNLTYSANPVVYVVGSAITPNISTSGGGAVTTYSVTPALPTGLYLNPISGTITGTPTVVKAASSYTVYAANAAGSANVSLSIQVNDLPPTSLTYSANPATYPIGVVITPNSPTVRGGVVTTYSVAPSLPAGLALNASTGVISGTPMALADSAYVVSATNSGGSTSSILSIKTTPPAPPAIVTQPTDQTAPVGATARFSVAATGTGTLRYQWSRNASAIDGATAASYALTPVSDADAGAGFSVTISDAYGANVTSNVVTLRVGGSIPTGSLAEARTGHTATLLPTGKVLVAGGTNLAEAWATRSLASAELYDPATGIWTPTGSMAVIRYSHTATLLKNGMVLVVGGYTQDSPELLRSAELYDPSTGWWSSTGSMTNGKGNHASTLLLSGQVLVSGGINAMSACELYDPDTGTWSVVGSLVTGRTTHAAVLLPSGKVLAAGGRYAALLASAEVFDSSTAAWTSVGLMPNAKAWASAILLPTGKVLVQGWADGDQRAETRASGLFDPTTSLWSASGEMAALRSASATVLIPSGHVLVFGGASLNEGSVESYDASTGAWSNNAPVLIARAWHSATVLPNGTVLVVGGISHGVIQASAEIWTVPH